MQKLLINYLIFKLTCRMSQKNYSNLYVQIRKMNIILNFFQSISYSYKYFFNFNF